MYHLACHRALRHAIDTCLPCHFPHFDIVSVFYDCFLTVFQYFHDLDILFADICAHFVGFRIFNHLRRPLDRMFGLGETKIFKIMIFRTCFGAFILICHQNG